MPLSSHARNALIEHLLSGYLYLSAHSADPGLEGAHECAGGGYARQPAAFGDALNGEKALAAAVQFDDLPKAILTHVGVWDAPAGGRFLYGLELDDPRACLAGDTLRLGAGKLKIWMK